MNKLELTCGMVITEPEHIANEFNNYFLDSRECTIITELTQDYLIQEDK